MDRISDFRSNISDSKKQSCSGQCAGQQVPRAGAGSGFFGTATGMGSSRTAFLGTLGTSKISVYFSFVGCTDVYETIRQSITCAHSLP